MGGVVILLRSLVGYQRSGNESGRKMVSWCVCDYPAERQDKHDKIHPPERVGDLRIRVDGARPSANVTLIAEISSTIAVNKTLFGITKIVEGEKDSLMELS